MDWTVFAFHGFCGAQPKKWQYMLQYEFAACWALATITGQRKTDRYKHDTSLQGVPSTETSDGLDGVCVPWVLWGAAKEVAIYASI